MDFNESVYLFVNKNISIIPQYLYPDALSKLLISSS